MDEFRALIESLGTQIVAYVGEKHLSAVAITASEAAGIAHVQIKLDDDTWSEREHAVTRMLEVRQMFLDDISVDYAFVDQVAPARQDDAPLAGFSFAAA